MRFFGIFVIVSVLIVGGYVGSAPLKEFLRKNSASALHSDKNKSAVFKKEIVLPRETGVADSGFEGKFDKFSVLNAEVSYDTREKIDGVFSLKMHFFGESQASVKLTDYIDGVQEGEFYRLSFLVKNSPGVKNIALSLVQEEKVQSVGEMSLDTGLEARYREFLFRADNDATDLIMVSHDGAESTVWMDDLLVEKVNVDSEEALRNLSPTLFGETMWKNVDREQTSGPDDSGDFLATPGRRIGQVFQPNGEFVSGVAFLAERKGTGGTGQYQIQIRSYDDRIGTIGSDVIALRGFDFGYSTEELTAIAKKEKQMRLEAEQMEKRIKEERVTKEEKQPPTVSSLPESYFGVVPGEQKEAAEAKVRAEKLEIAIRDMKESFNGKREVSIPLSAKLDPNKKYWIGVDNAGVVVDQNNYIKVSLDGAKEKTGFSTEMGNSWKNSPTLWYRLYYPKFVKSGEVKMLTGASIVDLGDAMLYRYQFNPEDYSLMSSFSGRKVFDLFSGDVRNTDLYGNYLIEGDKYAEYRFDALHSVKKVIIRNILYHKSLRVEFSSNGEEWREIYAENPNEMNQTFNDLVIRPDSDESSFYLRMSSYGDFSTILSLVVEAELEK